MVDPQLLPQGYVSGLGVRQLLVNTDGSSDVGERLRNAVLADLPASDVRTAEELRSEHVGDVAGVGQFIDAALLVVLALAGVSLAASAVGGILERRRPFALLRAAGMPPRELRRVAFVEATLPLVSTTLVSAVLGIAVAAALLSVERGTPISLPAVSLALVVGVGLFVAMGIVAASLQVVERSTRLDAVRTE